MAASIFIFQNSVIKLLIVILHNLKMTVVLDNGETSSPKSSSSLKTMNDNNDGKAFI